MLDKLMRSLEGMPPRKIILVCLAAAVLVFAFLYVGLSSLFGNHEDAAKNQVRYVTKIEAARDIRPSTMITDDMVKLVTVEENALPKGALTNKQDVIGRLASVEIKAGETMTEAALLPKSTNQFTGMIPEGMRAVSFAINDVSGVSGFAKPGDKVDILLVSDKVNNDMITSKLILKDVLLLGINKTAQQVHQESAPADNKNGASNISAQPVAQAQSPAVATVALSPYDSAKLTASAQAGQLYIMLRPATVNDENASSAFYVVPLPKKDSGAAAPAPYPTAPSYYPLAQQGEAPTVSVARSFASPTDSIEVIRGTNVTRGK